jgi:hypothetical protein
LLSAVVQTLTEGDPPGLSDVEAFLAAHPDVLALNRDVPQKAV